MEVFIFLSFREKRRMPKGKKKKDSSWLLVFFRVLEQLTLEALTALIQPKKIPARQNFQMRG